MSLETLIQQPESLRDNQWELQFLDALVPTKVDIVGDQPQNGPDGWPYMLVRTSTEGKEPFQKVVQWLSGRGIGLVVNPHKMVPDYVFTYGMIWNFTRTGRFVMPGSSTLVKAPGPERVVVEPGQKLLMGPPTEDYLPSSVRDILREFLAQQALKNVRILVLTTSDFKQTDLALSLESLGPLSDRDQKSLAQALSWFLPLHYSLVLISEQGLPPFVSL